MGHLKDALDFLAFDGARSQFGLWGRAFLTELQSGSFSLFVRNVQDNVNVLPQARSLASNAFVLWGLCCRVFPQAYALLLVCMTLRPWLFNAHWPAGQIKILETHHTGLLYIWLGNCYSLALRMYTSTRRDDLSGLMKCFRVHVRVKAKGYKNEEALFLSAYPCPTHSPRFQETVLQRG